MRRARPRSSSRPRRIRTRRRSGLAVVAAVALAGCGGGGERRPQAAGPRLAHADAARLITLSDRIAHDAPRNPCRVAREVTQLRSAAIELLNTGRVPQRLQEPLLSGVNAVQAPACVPPAPPPAAVEGDRGHGRGHGHGHGKGKTKHDD